MATEDFGGATLRRVEWLTLVFGGIGAAWAAWHWGWRGGLGLALGAVISWVNFRWLKGSVRAFGGVQPPPATPSAGPQAAPGQAQDQPVVAAPVPLGAFAKFLGRFALLLGAVYVILTRSWLPAASLLAGLFASAAAVVAGIVYELVSSGVKQSANGRS